MENIFFEVDDECKKKCYKSIKMDRLFFLLSPIPFLIIAWNIYKRRNYEFNLLLVYLFPISLFMWTMIIVPIWRLWGNGKVIFAIQQLGADQFELHFLPKGFNKEGKQIIVNNDSLEIIRNPISPKLFGVYSMNRVYVDGNKKYIFQKLLEKSGL